MSHHVYRTTGCTVGVGLPRLQDNVRNVVVPSVPKAGGGQVWSGRWTCLFWSCTRQDEASARRTLSRLLNACRCTAKCTAKCTEPTCSLLGSGHSLIAQKARQTARLMDSDGPVVDPYNMNVLQQSRVQDLSGPARPPSQRPAFIRPSPESSSQYPIAFSINL